MKKDHSPHRLDVAQFAKEQGRLSDHTPLRHLSRLLSDLVAVPRETDQPYGVQWEACGWTGQAANGQVEQPWLGLQGRAVIPQICQRCAALMDFPIELDYQYRFVATEKEADEQDEWAQEDVLVVTKSMDLLQLIEDEVLMAMPLIPMHDRCEIQLPTEVVDPAFHSESVRPNPFEMLKSIKKSK